MRKIICILLLFIHSVNADTSIKIFNWPEYIDVEILKQFTSQTGTKIEYDIFHNNEELIENIRSKKMYDVVFPSASFLSVMIDDDLLEKLDTASLDNYKNIDSFFVYSERSSKYAIPYAWGTTGLVYNSNLVKIDSFEDLWSDNLRDQVFILNDMHDMFAIALNTLGFDVSTDIDTEIYQAYEKLIALIPNIKGFFSNTNKLKLDFINENASAAVVYNGDIADLSTMDNTMFKYINPKEGALLWVDVICIPKNAENKKVAYQFIDYLISKNISQQNAQSTGYTLPIKGIELNPLIYPTKKQKANLKRVEIRNKEALYKKYWNMFLDKLSSMGVKNES